MPQNPAILYLPTDMRPAATILTLFLLCAFASGQVKKATPPPVAPAFQDSLQIIVVTTPNANDIHGMGRLFERKNKTSSWKAVGDKFPVVVGRSGLAWDGSQMWKSSSPKAKKEGDGNAPAGVFPLTSTFGTSPKPNAVELPYTRLDQYTECVDDTRSSFYNRIVNRMQVGNFDWKSSEKMLAVGPQYELGVFVGYNSYPVKKGDGSCIFLHVWKDANSGTSGCTAMERHDLERLVALLQPSKSPFLVQMPEDDYSKNRNTWKLPKLK